MSNSNSNPKRIGTKLQRVALFPIIFGIAICATLTLAILYSKLINWISFIESTLETREQDHIKRLALSSSQRISSIISNVNSN